MADLVERAQARHRPPGTVAPEAGHSQFGHRACVLRQGYRAVVELDQLNPSGVEVVEQAGLAERRAHTEDRRVLIPLIRDVLAVGRAVGLVPVAPRVVRQPGPAADLLGEEFPLGYVAGSPVDLAGEVEPVITSEYHSCASSVTGVGATLPSALRARTSPGVRQYGFSMSVPPASTRG